MLALLAIIAWAGSFLYFGQDFFDERKPCLAIATLAVQLGFVISHFSGSDFPFDTSMGDWAEFGYW